MNYEPHCVHGFHGSAISVFCFPLSVFRSPLPDLGGLSARVFCGGVGQLAGYAISAWPTPPRFLWVVRLTVSQPSQSVFSVDNRLPLIPKPRSPIWEGRMPAFFMGGAADRLATISIGVLGVLGG
jgi:hypothetical protein